MFHFFVAIPCLIVIARYLAPLHWPLWVKIPLSALLLLISQHHLMTYLAFGSMFSPEVPRIMVLAINWLFGAMIFLAVLQLLVDLGTAILMVIKRRRLAIPALLRYAIGAIALAMAAFAVNQAVRVPPMKEVEIAIAELPAQFDGYQIIHLTDLHISRLFETPWVDAVVAKTNALAPDLIVITGDLIDGDLEARRADVAPLQALSAPDGIYASPGNHEYYFGYEQWMAHYQSLGMQTLANQHAVINRDGADLVLAGITDLRAPRTGWPAPDVEVALAGAPANAPIILLDHQPFEAVSAAAAGVDVQLSGHTHGGMIWGFDRIVARANNGFVSGMYDVEGMALYVNNGTGLWPGFALRLGKPSELTRITLRQK
ncbi:metallophosphoesterase [Vreelandella populi]|uniref:Metallophosphoesterase n=1 Tax=Vreelandella populi TaxID=2498858 RepID=A0A433LDF8_9GAMM|nr:metallophosphoesterase [Halomonas populi]RUR39516.1 metallophosphoesterase [Halomonas populi]RUR46629.1 metallophosphoesterase [Halomonas populi]RUR52869.1 metallophosphoesterase [Halomonas populi]